MAASESKYFKVPVLGDNNVGKALLMNKYVNCVFKYNKNSTGAVGGDFVSNEEMIHTNTIATMSLNFSLQLLKKWDTGSQERFDSIRLSLIRGADCCVLVYDVTDEKSFENLDYWREEFLSEAAPKDPLNFPFVLIGNKVDLQNRKISKNQAEEWCFSRNQCPYFETSAKNGMNVDAAFEKIAELVIKRKTEKNGHFNNISIHVIRPDKEKNDRNHTKNNSK